MGVSDGRARSLAGLGALAVSLAKGLVGLIRMLQSLAARKEYQQATGRPPSVDRLHALNVLPTGDPSGDTRRMAASTDQNLTRAQLRCGIVLHVQEDACQILRAGQLSSVRFAEPFPSPRTKRVSPGHLVAVAGAADGAEAVVWRWYDAVVLGEETGLVRLWEPAHGEVVAHPRHDGPHRLPGTRAYLSAGLPGADWWVAGAAVVKAEDADVELDEVERFCTEHGLWPGFA